MNRHEQILLVEDKEDVRELFTCILAEYRVVAVADGLSTLQYLTHADELPALIVSDCRLPDISGVALMETVRNDHRTVDIPVMLMSADQESALHPKLVQANAFLVMPFMAAAMRAYVMQLFLKPTISSVVVSMPLLTRCGMCSSACRQCCTGGRTRKRVKPQYWCYCEYQWHRRTCSAISKGGQSILITEAAQYAGAGGKN